MLINLTKRLVTSRCISYTEPWVWSPHSETGGYFEELMHRPLKDAITGTEVYVMGVSEYSGESAGDVRKTVRNMREGPRGRKLDVCVDCSDLKMLQAVTGCFEADVGTRQEQTQKAADLGYPPDVLATHILAHQQQGLLPYQATTAAVVECTKRGIPLHFLGLNESQPFHRLRHVNVLSNDFLTQGDQSLIDQVPSIFGLHADIDAHLDPATWVPALQSRPTPSLVHTRLTSVDLPTLFFRYVQPTVHMVQEVKKLMRGSEHNNGAVLVVIDAWCAPMFYKIFKDAGLSEEDGCGAYYNFREKHEIEDREVDEVQTVHEAAMALTDLTETLSEDASEGKLQAEFEVQLLLFLQLCRVRPDLLKYKQAVVNVYITHGMVSEAICFLRKAVDEEHSQGAYNVLTSMVMDLINDGLVDQNDPLVEFAMRPMPDAPSPKEPLKLIEAPKDRPTSRMVAHNEIGIVAHSQESLPEFKHLETGEISEQRRERVGNMLMEYQQHEIAKHEPDDRAKRKIELKRKQYERMKFSVPHHHPFSDEYNEDGGDLPTHGIITTLPQYVTNEDFPAPLPKHELPEHAKSAERSIASLNRESAVDQIIRESKRIRTQSPPRSSAQVALLASKKEDRKALRRYKAKLRDGKNWARAEKFFSDQ